MVVIWIGISIAALVVELITPTALVSIWFAVGGIIAVLLSLLNLPIWVQIAGFAIVSIVSMLVVDQLHPVIYVGIQLPQMRIAALVNLVLW